MKTIFPQGLMKESHQAEISFHTLLQESMGSMGDGDEAESGLYFLLNRHQTGLLKNKSNGSAESKFAIPDLGEKYKSLEALEGETLEMLDSLQKAKPGFMLSFQDINPEYKDESLYTSSVFSFDKIEENYFLTLGEENAQLAKKFTKFLKEMDKKFDKADKDLKKIARLYKTGRDSELGKLMLLQRQSRLSDEPAVGEFTEQQRKYNELKNALKPTLKEIKEERSILKNIKNEIKALPLKGASARNLEAINEYPALGM